jgi:hypothetical protein
MGQKIMAMQGNEAILEITTVPGELSAFGKVKMAYIDGENPGRGGNYASTTFSS